MIKNIFACRDKIDKLIKHFLSMKNKINENNLIRPIKTRKITYQENELDMFGSSKKNWMKYK